MFPVLHGVQDVLLDRGRDRGPWAVGSREVLADDLCGNRILRHPTHWLIYAQSRTGTAFESLGIVR